MTATILQLPASHRMTTAFRMAAQEAQAVAERPEDHAPHVVETAHRFLTNRRNLERLKQ